MSDSQSSVTEVFKSFLRLGLTSFGGPAAHIGYFRIEFVEKRRWLSEGEFAQLLAMCQFLPGPASSQLGFCLGLLRAGWAGAMAAFFAFTAPSILMMLAFALSLPLWSGEIALAAIHGLKILALAVVAHAVWGMANALCPDWPRRVIAVLAAALMIALGLVWMQILLVVAGALIGALLLQAASAQKAVNPSQIVGKNAWCIPLFLLCLLGLPLAAQLDPALAVMDVFYRAGAMVFGGGHVVLPLLEESVVGRDWLSAQDFIAGYGAAQALPGPLFSFSAYLGAVIDVGLHPGAVVFFAILGMFLPGFLLAAGFLSHWQKLSAWPKARQALAGVNAVVVGLLAAALYDPVFTSAVTQVSDFLIAVAAFALLMSARVPVLVVVAFCVVANMALALLL